MLSPVYSPYDLTVERAAGIQILTDRGVFLDAFSGLGALPLGHSHPDVVRAMTAKAKRYAHISNYFLDPDAPKLADALLAMTGREGEVIFTNSGAEATEAAIKAVRKLRGGAIASFEGNFHGRTTGALSITWSPAMREPYGPLLPGCVFLPLDGEALLDFARREEVAAVFLECVQGNSGVHPIPAGLASAVSELQRERGVLVVADEIQAGLGRTGRYFSYEHYGLAPDMITVGKGIGGGLPLGATLFLGVSPFGAGDHGSTFAPNPVSLAAGRAVLGHLTPALLEEVARKGEKLRRGLERLSWANEVRGLGLMVGVGTDRPEDVASRALERGLLVNRAGGGIRLLPALTVTDLEIEEILSRLEF